MNNRQNITRTCDKCGEDVSGRTHLQGKVTCYLCKADKQRQRCQRAYAKTYPKKRKLLVDKK